MAAHAFFAVEPGPPVFVQTDGLMAPVGAGDDTAAAADTFLPMELWEDHRVPFQHVRGVADGIEGQAPSFLLTI